MTAATARRWTPLLLPGAYALGWTLLAWYGLRFWRTACEGFGCTGLGIAWLLWAGVYACVLGLGLVSPRPPHRGLRTLLRCLLASQLVAGLGLLVHWWRHVAV